MNLIQYIKNLYFKQKRKEIIRQKERIILEVKEEYNIIERNGTLYLTVGNQAVSKIDEKLSVKEVISLLNEARNAQISFKELTIN